MQTARDRAFAAYWRNAGYIARILEDWQTAPAALSDLWEYA